MLLVLNFYSLTVLPIDCGPGILEQAIFFIDFSTLWLEIASGRQRGEPFFRYSRQYNKIQPTRRCIAPLVEQFPWPVLLQKPPGENAVRTLPRTKLPHPPYVQAHEFLLETLR
jgi:hypothetical protein